MSEYETRLWIDGQLVQSQSGKTFDLYSPVSNKLLAKVPEASAEDIDKAVAAAQKAQPQWAALPATDRANVLRKFAALLLVNASELAKLDGICMGKPANQHAGDIKDASDIIKYYSGLVELASGESSLNSPNHLNLLLRQPYGVVAAIVPWNFPTAHLCYEIGPACGAGNAMILKTSEKSPLSGILLAKLSAEAGFPPGIVNIVSGPADTGKLLAAHMSIRKISFTGSTTAGRAIMQAAAKSNLKVVALELGGKSPLIVFDDADLELAATEATASITYNSGQVCTASSRAYVHKNIFDKFAQLLREKFAQLKPGALEDAATNLGPQVDAIQTSRIERYLGLGRDEGQVIVGGQKDDTGPNYIKPTVFTELSDSSAVNVEEVFGPVLVLHQFETEAEAIRRANDSEYGLYASVYSNNINTAIRVAAALEAGSVGVNCTSPYGHYDLPFGGYKASGIGRQKGSRAIEEWLEQKSVFFRYESAKA